MLRVVLLCDRNAPFLLAAMKATQDFGISPWSNSAVAIMVSIAKRPTLASRKETLWNDFLIKFKPLFWFCIGLTLTGQINRKPPIWQPMRFSITSCSISTASTRIEPLSVSISTCTGFSTTSPSSKDSCNFSTTWRPSTTFTSFH